MGKNIIQQARGKGGPTYRAPSFRYIAHVQYPSLGNHTHSTTYRIDDIVYCPGHSAPLVRLKSDAGDVYHVVASEGLKVGGSVSVGDAIDALPGNILSLRNIPEGTPIFNVELVPGDGGKFVRSSGTFAKVLTQTEEGVVVLLPSKKKRLFHPNCRATVGIVAGGGRLERPFLKAGNRYHKARQRNKLYPRVSAAKMNAVDHPFGNSRSLRKSKARPISRNAPPGRKVGLVGARRTGRK